MDEEVLYPSPTVKGEPGFSVLEFLGFFAQELLYFLSPSLPSLLLFFFSSFFFSFLFPLRLMGMHKFDDFFTQPFWGDSRPLKEISLEYSAVGTDLSLAHGSTFLR